MNSRRTIAPLAGAVARAQPDSRLVTLSREGRERAFEEIVRRYRGPLIAYAGAVVPRDRAEDVVQDALTKAHSALRSSDAEIHLRPWLYTIVRNTALNDLRDEPRHDRVTEDFDGVPQPPQVAEHREELAELVRSLQGLPDSQREALIKREMAGESHEEIASSLGTTPGAVRGLIFRARRALRDGVGMLIPLPVIRFLLSSGDGAVTGAAGAGAGGAALGTALGGGGGAGAKIGVAAVVAALAVGSGVALERHEGSSDDSAAAEARNADPDPGRRDLAGAREGVGGGSRESEPGDDRGGNSGPGGNSGHGGGSGPGGSSGPGGGGHGGGSGPGGSSGPGGGGDDGGSDHGGPGEGTSGGGETEDVELDGGDGDGIATTEDSGSSGSGSGGSGGGDSLDDDGGGGSGPD